MSTSVLAASTAAAEVGLDSCPSSYAATSAATSASIRRGDLGLDHRGRRDDAPAAKSA